MAVVSRKMVRIGAALGAALLTLLLGDVFE
jgi:VIT1/CCC1 family predicted Fe2+/Mn2+ transporter